MSQPNARRDLTRLVVGVVVIALAGGALLGIADHSGLNTGPDATLPSARLRISHGPPTHKTVRAGRSVPLTLWLTNTGTRRAEPAKVCAHTDGLPRSLARLNHSCTRFESIPPGRYRRVRWHLGIDAIAEGRVKLRFSVYLKSNRVAIRRTGLRVLPVTSKPRINQRPIPFGSKRKNEMARYSKRHYGRGDWRLRQPKQIVEHYAVASTLAQIFNAFRSDRPDPEYGELPNVCAHFAIDGTGRIQQFVNLRTRCRHVVGLNHVAIGIEHTGFSDGQVLSDRRQMRASLKLTRWLRCRYSIKVADVIGHNESLSSRYYRERVPSMRNQTHGDFRHRSMQRYRHRLRALGPC